MCKKIYFFIIILFTIVFNTPPAFSQSEDGYTFIFCDREFLFNYYKNKTQEMAEDCNIKSSLFVKLEQEEKKVLEFSKNPDKTYIPPEITID